MCPLFWLGSGSQVPVFFIDPVKLKSASATLASDGLESCNWLCCIQNLTLIFAQIIKTEGKILYEVYLIQRNY